jgi:Glycosyltransferase family 87
MRRSVTNVLIVVLVAARLAVLPLILSLSSHQTPGYDVRRYQQFAHGSHTPYVDFPFEKPPLGLAELELVAGRTPQATRERLGWSQLVLDLLVSGLLAIGWGRGAAAAYLLLATPLIPFLYFRTDLLSVALALGGLLLAVRRRQVLAGTALMTGTLTKIWPLALVPVLVVRRSWRALSVWMVGLAIGLGLWIAWAGWKSPIQTLPLGHGWQIESMIGSVLRLTREGAATFESGTYWIGNDSLWTYALAIGAAAPLGYLVLLSARQRPEISEGLFALTIVASLLLLSPLLSPQYIVWLTPWAAVAAAAGERGIVPLVLGISSLTAIELAGFARLVVDPWPFGFVVMGRNILLIILVARGIRRIRGATSRTSLTPPEEGPVSTVSSERARFVGNRTMQWGS